MRLGDHGRRKEYYCRVRDSRAVSSILASKLFESSVQFRISNLKPTLFQFLLDEGVQRVALEQLHGERFVNTAPAEVVATLLDEGVYLASERTLYRLLAQQHESGERRNQLTHPALGPFVGEVEELGICDLDRPDLGGRAPGESPARHGDHQGGAELSALTCCRSPLRGQPRRPCRFQNRGLCSWSTWASRSGSGT